MNAPLSNPVVRNWLYIVAGCAGAFAALTKLAVAVGWLTPAAADALYDLWTWLAGLSSVGNFVASTVLSRQRQARTIRDAVDAAVSATPPAPVPVGEPPLGVWSRNGGAVTVGEH